ncbi:hypothetical protein [Mesorhizobium huakuii]|uniref:Uncharacterized protein n=1 Tax=Mesorhizobium huakuii TaxID=28104 RepID=A0ABZ0VJR7_9HYPH|nr:hypothetical protein [Mesorhizobium huakuii]WQB97485.1 hypothetical protein U0R22_001617 [Mesorhizobium huakuii]
MPRTGQQAPVNIEALGSRKLFLKIEDLAASFLFLSIRERSPWRGQPRTLPERRLAADTVDSQALRDDAARTDRKE